MKNKKLLWFIRLLLVLSIIFWMSLIFKFSAQTGTSSASSSHSILYLLGRFSKTLTGQDLIRSLSPASFKKVEFIIRKCAHMFLYFILSILTLLYLFTYKNLRFKNLITLSICFLYACSDEIHQFFVGGRSASFKDVLIDTTGAGIGLFIIFIITSIVHKKVHH